MTDETKKLFDAPWQATNLDYVEDANGFCVCECGTHLTASNIARLPELYDALAEATRRYCGICYNLSGQDEPKIEDLIKNGCPKTHYKNRAYVVSCVALDWLELLRKVRNGE